MLSIMISLSFTLFVSVFDCDGQLLVKFKTVSSSDSLIQQSFRDENPLH